MARSVPKRFRQPRLGGLWNQHFIHPEVKQRVQRVGLLMDSSIGSSGSAPLLQRCAAGERGRKPVSATVGHVDAEAGHVTEVPELHDQIPEEAVDADSLRVQPAKGLWRHAQPLRGSVFRSGSRQRRGSSLADVLSRDMSAGNSV